MEKKISISQKAETLSHFELILKKKALMMRFSLLQFLNMVEMKKFACLSRVFLTFVDPNQEYLP